MELLKGSDKLEKIDELMGTGIRGLPACGIAPEPFIRYHVPPGTFNMSPNSKLRDTI
jgi:hypothetical protein